MTTMVQKHNGENLQAPFPYFGGKARVADVVWAALGDVKHYIEPFFGSGAVLLARPGYDQSRHIETICDADGYICNVWRSLQSAPKEVARVCDWPVNHADLSARRKVLIEHGENLLNQLIADDKYYDTELAGYWIWAASCWMGSGLFRKSAMPNVSKGGEGVHRIGKRPRVSDSGEGVQDPYNINIYTWFRDLSERLRYVRVVCGDWTKVCGGNWQDKNPPVGIFFDPPYASNRAGVYGVDSYDVAHRVREWAIPRGKKKTYRICIAGYEEHDELARHGWTSHRWSTDGGYGNRWNGKGKENRHRERLWFSPHCVRRGTDETSLF